MLLENKKVLITGASRGIGKALALACREAGAYVIGTATVDSEALRENCNEVYEVNFYEEDQLQDFIHIVRMLEVDVLINNAGINKIDSFCDIRRGDFMEIQQVNIQAPFLLCQAVIPNMKRNGWGRIVNVSSIWGKISKEFRASYSASKFALDGMTLALSAEHASDGVLANCIAPGFTDTELTRKILGEEGMASLVESIPIGRMANVEEIASFAVWLSSNENTYITGQNIAIDGGYSRA